MDDNQKPEEPRPPQRRADKGEKPMGQPQWADSLRNLYDSVVDEPIPDSFKDLLEQLDARR